MSPKLDKKQLVGFAQGARTATKHTMKVQLRSNLSPTDSQKKINFYDSAENTPDATGKSIQRAKKVIYQQPTRSTGNVAQAYKNTRKSDLHVPRTTKNSHATMQALATPNGIFHWKMSGSKLN
jgi:hypothetical protein